MFSEDIGYWSHIAGAVGYAVLAGLGYPAWRHGRIPGWLIGAALLSAVTMLLYMIAGQGGYDPRALIALNGAFYGIWSLALVSMLRHVTQAVAPRLLGWPLFCIWLGVSTVSMLHALRSPAEAAHMAAIWNMVLLAIPAIVCLEQVFRNAHGGYRPAIRLFAVGLIAIFGYDFYLAAHSLLFREIDLALWQARGLAHAISTLVIMAGLSRLPDQPRLALSRNVAFYTTSLTGAGIFLSLMALGGYYLQIYGGDWGNVLQVTLVFAAMLGTLTLFSSSSSRAWLKVMINKHFFNHKYDYREVWLRLIRVLSQPITEEGEVYQRALKAVTNIFQSPGGSLWICQDGRAYVPIYTENMSLPDDAWEDVSSEFLQVMREEDWVFDLGSSHVQDPHSATLPAWLSHMERPWLIMPLNNEDQLLGFIALARPVTPSSLTWEDLDVLRTVGRQLGNFLARHQAAEQLAQSKQFDAYHKLTAFIMHDLKNLIAQQALVVQNAAKHKENPAFVEDAINTIDNSVQRMSGLLKKLQQQTEQVEVVPRLISLSKILMEAVKKCKDIRPIPSLRLQGSELLINADHDHLVMIFVHLVRNAQEATAETGFVDIRMHSVDGNAIVEVEDNGEGMDQTFLQTRLFRPFDTTKSGKGMGIGAFQAREFIRSLGGDITVLSSRGNGTTFTISIPLAAAQDPAHELSKVAS